jgi:DNA adenine methylase
MAKPIVKWAGGKTKLLEPLTQRVPTQIRTYAEPFAGGAALFFALADDPSRTIERAVLADQNEDLVACYRAVRDDVEALLVALAAYKHDEEEYYRVRDRDPRGLGDAERGARLIYLNRTCFNGLWRVNRQGKFNVPFGRYTNPRIVDADGLRAASRALARTKLLAADFAEVTRDLGPGDFAYFDPPYVPVSKSASFTSYAREGFGPADQDRLLAELHRLAAAGVTAILSNADTEATRALYSDFAVHLVTAPRAINSKGGSRGHVGELIVTSWGAPGVVEPERPAAPAKPRARGRKAAST